jgi:hypothetical protein
MKKSGVFAKIAERYSHNRRFEFSYLQTLLIDRYSASERSAIEVYKNKHRGQAGVIVASGPSLNDINFEKLKKIPTIGMNRIYLLYDKTDFRPAYYCLEDHLVAEDNASEINSLTGSVMFIPKDLSYCINGNKNILYANLIRRYKGAKQQSRFSEDFAEKVYWGGTVTYYALQLAYYLGFEKVYLVGLDHNYTRPDYAKGPTKVISRGADINHFDPRYFGKGKRWHAPDDLISRMEISYREAKRVFEKSGRQIINATPKSNLSEDVFIKTDLESIPEFADKKTKA